MSRELAAIYDELVRRHKAGEQSVYLSEDSLAFMRTAAGRTRDARNASVTEEAVKEESPKPLPKARSAGKEVPDVPEPPVFDLPDGSKAERMDWLRERVIADPWCVSQVKPGKRVVLGVGSLDARIFFCGEAPGADEEVKGEPFVGPAGQLLTKIIQAMGLTRETVYIGNIMNYRPPMPGPVGNRPPSTREMAYCLPYLIAQLEIVQPAAIVALGKTAVDGLLGADPKRRMGAIRGKWEDFHGTPVLPTYHPSYLLRNQSLATKRQVWEDMLTVMDRLEMPVTDKQRGFFL